MLLALLFVACNSDSNIATTPTSDDTPGTATRPIVEPVDSALPGDTGTTGDTQEPTEGPTGVTGDTGPEPIDTGVHVLEGRAFRFNPNAVSVVAGGAAITLFETNFLVEVLNVSPTFGTAEIRVASFDPNVGGQAICTPTVDVEGDFSGDPVFTFGPVDGTLGLFGKVTPIEMAEGTLRFSTSYDSIASADMTALWDINNFASYYYGAGYGSSLCSLLAAYYGGGCTTCPTSGSGTCMGITATNAEARWDTTTTLLERTENDVMTDPACF